MLPGLRGAGLWGGQKWGGGNPRQHSETSWVHIHGPPAQCTCLAPPFPLSVKNEQSNNGLCVRERMGKLGSEMKEEKRPRLFGHSMGRGSRRGTQRVPSGREGQSPWLWGCIGGWSSSWSTNFLIPAFCQMAHLSKKATRGRITRRTKPSSGVSTLRHSGAMGKAAHADLSTKVWML